MMLATVAVSGLQVLPHPGCRLGAHARFSCAAPSRSGAPPLLCTDVADQDIYGRAAVSEETIDVYGRLSSDFGDVTSEPVVKVYTAYSSQHPAMPWTNKAQEEATGSGFSIRHDGAMCIVTNAHVVADATYVEVRKAGDARKYVARRLKVAHESNPNPCATWVEARVLDLQRRTRGCARAGTRTLPRWRTSATSRRWRSRTRASGRA